MAKKEFTDFNGSTKIMKFAIISDSHDNEPNILKALQYIQAQNIKTIIHCGDVCNPESLGLFINNFSGDFYVCFGNGDYQQDEFYELESAYKNLHVVGEVGNLTLNNLKIAWNHYPARALELGATGQYDLVFYGHDHTPYEKTVGATKVLNPGTLAGLRNKATFAIYDTQIKKPQLIILQNI